MRAVSLRPHGAGDGADAHPTGAEGKGVASQGAWARLSYSARREMWGIGCGGAAFNVSS